MSVETNKLVNIVLLVVSLLANMWALLDLIRAIARTKESSKKRTGLVMAFAFIAMSVVGVASIMVYVMDAGHGLVYARTTAAAVANLLFIVAYWMLRKGLI